VLPTYYDLRLLERWYGLKSGRIHLLWYDDWDDGRLRRIMSYKLLEDQRSISRVLMANNTWEEGAGRYGFYGDYRWAIAWIHPYGGLKIGWNYTTQGKPTYQWRFKTVSLGVDRTIDPALASNGRIRFVLAWIEREVSVSGSGEFDFGRVTGVDTKVYVLPFFSHRFDSSKDRILLYDNYGNFDTAASFVSLGYDPRTRHFILVVTTAPDKMRIYLSDSEGLCWQYYGEEFSFGEEDKKISFLGPPSVRCVDTEDVPNCWLYYVGDRDPKTGKTIPSEVHVIGFYLKRKDTPDLLLKCVSDYRSSRIRDRFVEFEVIVEPQRVYAGVASLIGGLGVAYYEPENYVDYRDGRKVRDSAEDPTVLVTYWGQQPSFDFGARVSTLWSYDNLSFRYGANFMRFPHAVMSLYDSSVVYAPVEPGDYSYWVSVIKEASKDIWLWSTSPTRATWFEASPYDYKKEEFPYYPYIRGTCHFYSFRPSFDLPFWFLLVLLILKAGKNKARKESAKKARVF
jgi:hypothetical protein